jgi:putative N6-adenine-specific DNA methylase
MAEKHRFKKNREFKQRLEEQEQNEVGDIRSFTFHRHDLNSGSERRPRSGRKDYDHDDRKGLDRKKSFGRDDRKKPFNRDDRRKSFEHDDRKHISRGKRDFGKMKSKPNFDDDDED